MDFESIEYGQGIKVELNDEQKHRLEAGESIWEVIFYPTSEDRHQRVVREQLQRLTTAIDLAGFYWLEKTVAASDWIAISKEILLFLFEQAKSYRDHECW